MEDSLKEVTLRQDFKEKDFENKANVAAAHPHGNHMNKCMQIEARVCAKEIAYVPVRATDKVLFLVEKYMWIQRLEPNPKMS